MVREQSKSLQFAIHAVQGLQRVRVRDMPPRLHLIVTT